MDAVVVVRIMGIVLLFLERPSHENFEILLHYISDCPGLSSTSTTSVSVTAGLTAGSVATYACVSGYTLFGDVTRTCTAGSWTGVEPSCLPGK